MGKDNNGDDDLLQKEEGELWFLLDQFGWMQKKFNKRLQIPFSKKSFLPSYAPEQGK